MVEGNFEINRTEINGWNIEILFFNKNKPEE
jgi:hypothetical protein